VASERGTAQTAHKSGVVGAADGDGVTS
jgi:hypothetical protein